MNQIHAVLGCLIIVTISSQSCRASSLPEPASSISYSKKIPASIVKYRPARAKSRFYGTATIQGKKLAFHFYDVVSVDKSTPWVSRSEGRFDVFSVAAAKYRRINSIPVEFQGYSEQKVTIQLVATWLDPDQRTVPVILLRRTNQSIKYGGFNGQDILFTFAHGFDKAAAIDTFTRWRPDEGLHSGDVRYGPNDEKGFLTVVQLDFDRGTTVYTAYKWSGQEFVVFDTQTVKIDEYIYAYEWNGEKLIPKFRTTTPVSP